MKKDRFVCPECAHRFDPRGILACGVRQSYRDESMQVIFIEYQCPKCKKTTTLEFPNNTTIEEFAMMVIDDLEDQAINEIRRSEAKPKFHKDGKKARPKSKSRITKAEQKEVVDLMEECESFYEFLRRIGAPMDLAAMDPDNNEDFKVQREE
ncbi:MAG: hypothetical protein HC888_02330 [Candidatus Competibacteraceae bacterium]|nr:hypothetical protein [Candidatus Competibacteraceae bacterium]